MRYLIRFEYDGSDFIGWQKQKKGRSIQSVLESALAAFAQTYQPITAAGRTDAGVHALSQYAHFEYEGKMGMPQILLAFRRWLPDDVKILQIWKIDENFSARYQAYQRSYRYIMSKDRTPFNRNYSGFIPYLRLRLEPMQKAAIHLLGRHNFSSYGRLNPEVPNHICEIKEISIAETDDSYIFDIRADRFLHNMVRRIVGTLCNISHFDLPENTTAEILADRCPKQNIVTTAPPEGLYLVDVKYPAELIEGRETYKYEELLKRKP
ncbi:MAG TPA: tRNA pseudouridine(38-40) synthase TruA [Candidatus Cloacimonetes bacterium]|nr:tRNA pseudouridine(38-40) synthase TruA [Candidatus Cloacimonadota bacterium]